MASWGSRRCLSEEREKPIPILESVKQGITPEVVILGLCFTLPLCYARLLRVPQTLCRLLAYFSYEVLNI